jgi:hypothetical protein
MSVSSSQTRAPLGLMLVQSGLIDEAQLDEAVREATDTGERLGELVVRRGWASEDDVARLLAAQSGLDYLDRASIWFDADALARLSREDALQLEALPVRVEGDRVMIAVAEPTEQRLADLRRVVGDDTVVVVVAKTALDTGIDLLSSRGESAPVEAGSDEEPADEPEAVATEERHEAPPAPLLPSADDLASQARNFADSIAAQAETMRESEQRLAEQAEALRDSEQRIATLEAEHATALQDSQQRVESLEAELAEVRAAMQEAGSQLTGVLQLLGPS